MQKICKNNHIRFIFWHIWNYNRGNNRYKLKRNSNKFLSFILSFASGLMMAIICFDLIPEALNISNIISVILGILIGIITMIFCDLIVQRNLIQKK